MAFGRSHLERSPLIWRWSFFSWSCADVAKKDGCWDPDATVVSMSGS